MVNPSLPVRNSTFLLCAVNPQDVYWYLPMSHAKGSFLLFSFFIAAASLAQTSDAPKAKRPVATVDGQAIYDEDLAASVEAQLQPLRNQEYEIKRKALDNQIEQSLLQTAPNNQVLTTKKPFVQELH